MKNDLIQITIYADPNMLMDPRPGEKPITWRERLIIMKRDMVQHGRKAKIDKDKKTKQVALWANDTTNGTNGQQKMRDATLINLRTLEG